ncbi:S1 family peptidase [Actinopolyspora saharensis]|uniref:S1 family peptidase n=1 Tax=Actinopolyspora saharensis TaxID=995062 RepID=UPI003F661BC3
MIRFAKHGAPAGICSSAVLAPLALAVLITVSAVFGAGAARAVSDGTEVRSRAEAPWNSTLIIKGDGPLQERVTCGGALVTPRRVVTAAHCVSGMPLDELKRRIEVHVGARELSGDPGRTAQLTGVRAHPRYRLVPSPENPDSGTMSSATHDIAVLTLDRAVREVPTLPVADEAARVNDPAVLYGHGLTGPSSRGDVLRRGTYRVRPTEECAEATPAVVDGESMMCGRGWRAEACLGDSGGPLVGYRSGRPELIGVFSFGMETAGEPCGTAGPNFFTEVNAVHDWLVERLADPVEG